jgi:hypothetical protein
LSFENLEDIWSNKSGYFETAGSGMSKVCRLFKGRDQIMQDKKISACAERLAYIFIFHEVYERGYTFIHPLPKGLTRTSLAWNDIAKELGKESKDLQSSANNGRVYLRIFHEAGPGDLIVFKSTTPSL